MDAGCDFITCAVERKGLSFAGIVGKMKAARSVKITETLKEKMTQSRVTRSLKIISRLSRKMGLIS